MKRTDELEEIYRRNCRTVWNICYPYFMNSHDTEDAVQETFCRLMQSPRRFRDEDHEKAWLITTARNVCRDELRKARRRDVPLDTAEDIPAEAAQTWDTLAAVQALPEKYRTAVYLFYYEGYSVGQISKMLNRRESTLRSDLRRARLLLRERLKGANDEG